MIPETDQETTEGGLPIRDLLAVLEPVLDWYQGDEHPEREPLDILRDIVDDLQTDREAALVVGSAAADALALCHQIERSGCSPELTEASLMASRLREKLHSANTQDSNAIGVVVQCPCSPVGWQWESGSLKLLPCNPAAWWTSGWWRRLVKEYQHVGLSPRTKTSRRHLAAHRREND